MGSQVFTADKGKHTHKKEHQREQKKEANAAKFWFCFVTDIQTKRNPRILVNQKTQTGPTLMREQTNENGFMSQTLGQEKPRLAPNHPKRKTLHRTLK